MLNFYTAFLANTAVFKGIPVREIDKALACLHGFYKLFENGQEVFHSAEINPYAGIVILGCINEEQIGVDGKTVLLKQRRRGDLFGAAVSYLQQSNPFLRTISAEKSKVLFIKIPSIQDKVCCSCPYRMIVLENILKEVSRDTMHLNMKIQLLSQPSLRDKLLFYLTTMGNALQHDSFTREKLAQFICADRSAVSRELSRMKGEGLIKLEGKKITLIQKL